AGQVAALREQHTPVVVRVGVRGIFLQGLLVFGDRFVEAPLRGQRDTEVVVGLRVVRCDGGRVCVMLNRFVDTPLLHELVRQIVERDGRVGLDARGLRPQARRVVP